MGRGRVVVIRTECDAGVGSENVVAGESIFRQTITRGGKQGWLYRIGRPRP